MTRPIRQMAAVTTTMQRLEKDAHYPVNSSDEIGVLGRNINELYQNLWQTIRSLEHENKRITELEKEKIDERLARVRPGTITPACVRRL